MAEDEDQAHARVPELLEPSFDQRPTDAPALCVGHHGQRSQDGDRPRVGCTVEAGRTEQDVADRTVVLPGQQGQQRSRAQIAQQFPHEVGLVVTAEGGPLDGEHRIGVRRLCFAEAQAPAAQWFRPRHRVRRSRRLRHSCPTPDGAP